MAKKAPSTTAATTKSKRTPKTSKSRAMSSASRAIGIAGFDFEALNNRFRTSPGNEAVNYGVGIQPATVAADASYWKAIGVYHLTPDENRSRLNIFVDVLNESGQRAREMSVGWTWDGNSDPPSINRLDKPDNEPATDIPIFGSTFRLWVQGNEPSEIVTGINTQHPDERNAAGEILNSLGHHSFYVVFQRVRNQAGSQPGSQPGSGGAETTTPDRPVPTGNEIPPPTPVGATPSAGARLARVIARAAAKIGIDANAPIDESTGRISDQVSDPSVIADIGVGWVRINFIIGPWQHPHDQNRPFGRSWQETYQTIIDGFVNRGLKVYGLISDQALKEKPGGRLRGAPSGDLRGDGWIQNYANTFVTIARIFGDKVTVLESFNEPDDWKREEQPGWTEDTKNWIHPAWFATMLDVIYRTVRNDPSLNHIRIVSGPLQGLDVNKNAGAIYLQQTYAEGESRYGWGKPGVPYPFDGVGYHLYIAEGERQDVAQRLRDKYKEYMDGVRTAITAAEGRLKPIFISEIGWHNSGDLDAQQRDAMQGAIDAIASDSSVALGIWFCTQDFDGKPYGVYRRGGLSHDQRKAVYHHLSAMSHQEREMDILETIGARMATRLLEPDSRSSTAQREGSRSTTQWIGVVSAGELNVRSGPGQEHAKIGSLFQNSEVQVIGQEGEWLRIGWNGSTAFVNAKFVLDRQSAANTNANNTILTTWNRYRSLIEQESARLGIDPAVAVAVLVTEANGAAFAADGRMIIRFENHIFYNLWGKQNEARFRQHFAFATNESWKGHQWRPDPNAAWQPCHTNQAGEWLVFDFARSLDPTAAMMSISMGAPQIMGFNHRLVGYPSVQAMFDAFQADDDNQVGSLFRFIEVNNLTDALRRGDLRAFATVYNGSGQADHYAKIIQQNLNAFQALTASGTRALPSAMAMPAASAAPAPAVGESWNQQWLAGLDESRALLTRALQGITILSMEDALSAAQMSIALHSYWAQLAWVNDATTASSIVQSAANNTLSHLREVAASQRGGFTPSTQPTEPVVINTATNSATNQPRRRALCIGIDEYATSPLSGCVADAKLWAETLTGLGFEAPTLLLNQAATRSAILLAISDLINSSQPGDVIVIQYAGHGTQLGDVSGDEASNTAEQKDEALVPFDFTNGAYVIDDDLSAIFGTIRVGVNVTCFMDCCHSGSNTRFIAMGDERPRFMVATDEMIAAYRQFRQQHGISRSAGKRDLESMAEVVFAACQSTELAWESSGHGEFTLRATELVKSAAGSLSHEAFMQKITEAFGADPRQHPLMECAPGARGRLLLQALAK